MKLSQISNLLARSFLVFIIAWLWISFYVRGFILILFISTAITLGVNYLVSYIYKRRNNAKAITKQELEHIAAITLQLKFNTRAQTMALLKRALSPAARQYVTQRKIILCPLFHIQAPTEQDIIDCVKSAPKDAKIIITAERFHPTTTAFARLLDAKIVLLDAKETYTQILKPTQTYPEITVQIKRATPRKTLNEIKNMVFGRHRTKSYIITGAVILISSLIIRLHLYYIIFATLIFGLALSSYFVPKTPQNLFDP
jgi:hypothetical protein